MIRRFRSHFQKAKECFKKGSATAIKEADAQYLDEKNPRSAFIEKAELRP